MTDDEARALWIRLTKASPDSGWRPGMEGRTDDGRHFRIANDGAPYWGGCRLGTYPHSAWWGDLRDPATRGAAFGRVQERHPDAYLMPLWADLACTRRVWVVCRESDARSIGRGATEAEALVAALESKEPQ